MCAPVEMNFWSRNEGCRLQSCTIFEILNAYRCSYDNFLSLTKIYTDNGFPSKPPPLLGTPMPVPSRPEAAEYNEYFETYISLVEDANIFEALAAQAIEVQEFFNSVAPSELAVLHEPYTWTLKQVLGHCIDTERVLGYRANCIAVGEGDNLPGFDQDLFVAKVDYTSVPISELLEEFVACRRSHELMFGRFSELNWSQSGSASNAVISVRSLAYLMVGHVRYHLKIVRDRVATG